MNGDCFAELWRGLAFAWQWRPGTKRGLHYVPAFVALEKCAAPGCSGHPSWALFSLN